MALADQTPAFAPRLRLARAGRTSRACVGKRRYRRQERSLLERLREHAGKIRAERAREVPDDALIRYWEREMRAFEKGIERARKRRQRGRTLRAARRAQSRSTDILLHELRSECENVIELIDRLRRRALPPKERDEILGELAAAVLHLHVHTEGLDEFLCETE